MRRGETGKPQLSRVLEAVNIGVDHWPANPSATNKLCRYQYTSTCTQCASLLSKILMLLSITTFTVQL